ncbi:MAG: AI-2E family transporter [Minisyncoccia bacterium]
MDRNTLQRYFFIGLLIGVSILVFNIFLPFFEVLLLSVIFAVVLSPAQEKLASLMGGRRGLSALMLVFIFLLVILVPAFFLSVKLLDESKTLYTSLTDGSGLVYLTKTSDYFNGFFGKYLPESTINFQNFVSAGAGWIAKHITTILSSILGILTSLVLVFFSLFFFLRDGEKFKDIIVNLSPLSDKYDDKIVLRLKQTINATMTGVLLIAVLQGMLSGFGMWIFGIPNPTLWGSLSAIVSLVPGLGTTITFIPAILFSLIAGNTMSALGLTLWWVLAVSLIDNLLGPYLYSKNIDIHQLIMLFSVLGGLVFFGPVGFIFGPIAVALFFALIDVYQDLILEGKSL